MGAVSEKSEIRAAGLRATASRVSVLGLLRKSRRPLTHGEVVEALGEDQMDRTTLYRNLIDLAEAGLLSRVSLGSTWHFERVSAQLKAHPHFVCTECGVVECTPELAVTYPSARRTPRSVRRGEVELQLHGLCDACGVA